ncbi:OmpA family protein [Loktanella sp. SALINAS62]|uniref:OmpA family protein n=1 Tax=Loktanella sp. SALINAS62 TaxID=2706124 RepID=UPI001B8CB028|nr:OmpA family protein [Loktanella sp. SALINAS62]MBS1302117.1 OmpA family protein [Loktanella sp. SALINAS62]
MKRLALIALLLAGPVAAQQLALPGNAALQVERDRADARYLLPLGPWADGTLPTRAFEGASRTEVWSIDAPGIETLPILRSLREQLVNAGFSVVFECAAADCGGFDFRFAIPVEPPPAMQVDLGAFRFLSAVKDDQAVAVLVSHTPQAGFVQITRIADGSDDLPDSAADAPTLRTTAQTGDLATALLETGRTVLDGVTFQTGAVALMPDAVPSLRALSNFLADHPELAVSIVGHTDSEGPLDGNIAISRSRAAAVMERLVADYGVPRSQLRAAGMGYLAPIASNLTDDGRAANRRVEAIVTGTR